MRQSVFITTEGRNCKYKELNVHSGSTIFLLNVLVTPCAPERALFLLLYTVDVNDLRSNLNQGRVSVLLPLIRPRLRRPRGHSTVKKKNCLRRYYHCINI